MFETRSTSDEQFLGWIGDLPWATEPTLNSWTAMAAFQGDFNLGKKQSLRPQTTAMDREKRMQDVDQNHEILVRRAAVSATVALKPGALYRMHRRRGCEC